MLKGSVDGTLRLAYIRTDQTINVGDIVVTSGLGGVFPSGLIVGTVEDVIPESSGKSMYAVVRPAADVRDITSVFIITNYDPDTAAKTAAPAQAADSDPAETQSGPLDAAAADGTD